MLRCIMHLSSGQPLKRPTNQIFLFMFGVTEMPGLLNYSMGSIGKKKKKVKHFV